MVFLASRGYRWIAHDRRGHGRSSQPWNGNEMDTYADDLKKFDVPTLIIHGDDDQIVPIAASAILSLHSLGSDRFPQPIMTLDLPVKVRPWEIDCLPT